VTHVPPDPSCTVPAFDPALFRGRRVLVTGHTGFKGAWMAEWLLAIGADVHGIALPPESDGSLFERLGHSARLHHVVTDIRDAPALAREVARIRPDVVIHMAAQALVRRSYREPLETWATNVLGTLNLLEALRATGAPSVVVVVTTDKVYRNREWDYPYREVDELGGHDPYSASKAACEIAVTSWRSAYPDSGIALSTARAGNVLGGGDWSEDRIVPDCYRAWSSNHPAPVRNPGSTRPWQHVLEPLSGYLLLAQQLLASPDSAPDCCNFGPGPGGDRTVRELVDGLARGRPWTDASEPGAVHEARSLSLSIDRARHVLGWTPRLDIAEMLEWVDRGYSAGADVADIVREQVRTYHARCIA
jgi:CDP-glucose 4,6-dehydratase